MAKENNKLQWTVKHKGSFDNERDFLETVLIDCGVGEEKISQFLKPSKKHIHDPFLLKNMREAIELVRKHVKNDSKIFVKVDCD